MNNSSSVCPQCGVTIPEASAHGLCPRCVLAKALQPTTDQRILPPKPPDIEAIRSAFPHLEIIDLIGSGGMGAVFKARQRQLDRFVALKILPTELASQSGFSERFQNEARALAKLNHPHIVTIHDYGQANGLYYLLMEYVDGFNLRQILQSKRLTPKEALSIIPPICDALQCAHDHGIVHRDIKPENLLINRSAIIKIADFGIAKMARPDACAASNDDTPKASSTGSESLPFGSPDYAAPEQAMGLTDHRTDIYSLGVVLYEMLTGERPKDKIEPPSKRVQVDIRIDEIVLRALEKEPQLRFATVADFRTQIEAAIITTESPPGEWKAPEVGWGWLLGRMCGVTFQSRRAWQLANLSGLGFIAFLGFLPVPGWQVFFVFVSFVGLIAIPFLIEFKQLRTTSSRPRRLTSTIITLAGIILLLGSTTLNEIIDDLGLTKSARNHLQALKKATQAATQIKKAAVDNLMRLEKAKKDQNPNQAEMDRLATDVQRLHTQSMQADSYLTQVATLKEADEQMRIACFYLLAGVMLIAGPAIIITFDRTNHRPNKQ